MLEFSPTEPLQSKIRLLTKPFWFKEQKSTSNIPTVIVSDSIAKDLDLSVEDINAASEGVPVQINGVKYLATGIFDSQVLNALQDLDGF